jgi:hypothetical protein
MRGFDRGEIRPKKPNIFPQLGQKPIAGPKGRAGGPLHWVLAPQAGHLILMLLAIVIRFRLSGIDDLLVIGHLKAHAGGGTCAGASVGFSASPVCVFSASDKPGQRPMI